MKKNFVIFMLVFTMTTFSFGQKTNKVLKVSEEGKLLYRLEKASWYATDILLEKFADKRNRAGGYVSYLNEKNQVVTIFFEKDNPTHILVRFEFDYLPQKSPTKIDTLNQMATQQEIDLIAIRQEAIQKISENKDDFFSFYDNTSFNPIPLIQKEERKVFILTGPKVSNVVIIGNDYLLTYDKNNKLVKKEKLHNSLIQYPYKSDDPENKMETTMHSHVLSDLITLITSTDICTLLLYKDSVEWTQHCVMSKKYVSFFDLKKENLIVMTRKEWDKMISRTLDAGQDNDPGQR
ncbi:MAG: hypothetical protein FWF52_01875 [Candidatus Azobacteroides sp.]|nr:hypothetical protein [Candidatus Azobacteroides sp.]